MLLLLVTGVTSAGGDIECENWCVSGTTVASDATCRPAPNLYTQFEEDCGGIADKCCRETLCDEGTNNGQPCAGPTDCPGGGTCPSVDCDNDCVSHSDCDSNDFGWCPGLHDHAPTSVPANDGWAIDQATGTDLCHEIAFCPDEVDCGSGCTQSNCVYRPLYDQAVTGCTNLSQVDQCDDTCEEEDEVFYLLICDCGGSQCNSGPSQDQHYLCDSRAYCGVASIPLCRDEAGDQDQCCPGGCGGLCGPTVCPPGMTKQIVANADSCAF